MRIITKLKQKYLLLIKNKENPLKVELKRAIDFGDPRENRTLDSTLRGLRLSRLTIGPCDYFKLVTAKFIRRFTSSLPSI